MRNTYLLIDRNTSAVIGSFALDADDDWLLNDAIEHDDRGFINTIYDVMAKDTKCENLLAAYDASADYEPEWVWEIGSHTEDVDYDTEIIGLIGRHRGSIKTYPSTPGPDLWAQAAREVSI